MGLDKIWVFGEANGDAVASITLEMLVAARELADTVEVFMAGDGDDYAEELGEHGADTVYSTGDLDGALQGVAVASAVAAAIDGGDVDGPDAFLIGTTQDGRDVAGRLAVKLDTPVITNVVALEADGDQLVGSEPIFGGVTDVKVKNTSGKSGIFLVRPKSYEAEGVGGAEADTEDLDVPDLGAAGAARITATHAEESDGPKLDEASIVVSGGRGLGEAAAYGMIESIAKSLGGAAGASRAIVDAGWVPYSYQVGQTGKVVKPTVYLACGISGATQHLVGMKGSKNIIAINKDSEAPIFAVADLGIVGDVHKVLPKLIEALANR
jgi:electron transfer flavoprotein alpha subunit